MVLLPWATLPGRQWEDTIRWASRREPGGQFWIYSAYRGANEEVSRARRYARRPTMQNWSVADFIGVCAWAAIGCEKNEPAPVVVAAPEASAPEAPPAAEPTASAPTIPAPPDVGAAPDDAKKTASGLASKVLTPGTGKDHPGPNDTVKVHYTGWTKGGEMFDSSVLRGEPISFPLNGVIPGWTEGVGLMVVGEKRRLWIPAALAYGERPSSRRPRG